MDKIWNLVQLYNDYTITDGMDQEVLKEYFHSHGILAYKQFLSIIPDDSKINVGDGDIEGLINILNLINCRTTSSCSGHNSQCAFVVLKIEDMQDFECIHNVLTDFSGGQLKEYFGDERYWISTLNSGIRIDIDCSTNQLDEFGAWLFFLAIHDMMLSLDYGWKSKRIMDLCHNCWEA